MIGWRRFKPFTRPPGMKVKKVLTKSEERELKKRCISEFGHLSPMKFASASKLLMDMYCERKIALVNHMVAEGIKKA